MRVKPGNPPDPGGVQLAGAGSGAGRIDDDLAGAADERVVGDPGKTAAAPSRPLP
ncbi:MAG: hypothetical protein ACRDRV_14080 [Pseudonocardiaceae bacterium]